METISMFPDVVQWFGKREEEDEEEVEDEEEEGLEAILGHKSWGRVCPAFYTGWELIYTLMETQQTAVDFPYKGIGAS